MTAIYSLAHSCLQESPLQCNNSPISASPTNSLTSTSLNSGSFGAHSASGGRRSSFGGGHHSHHHVIKEKEHSQHGYGSYSATQHAMPLSVSQTRGFAYGQASQHVPSPVLSVSPSKQHHQHRSFTHPPVHTQTQTHTQTQAQIQIQTQPQAQSQLQSQSHVSAGTPQSSLTNLFMHHTAQPEKQEPAIPSSRAADSALASILPVSTAAPVLLQQEQQQAISNLTSTVSSPARTLVAVNPNLPKIHSLSINHTFQHILSQVDIENCDAAGENAFLICDLARVWERYLLWQRELNGDNVGASSARGAVAVTGQAGQVGAIAEAGAATGGRSRVEAFFAVKCNPDPLIIQLMVKLGLGFDCASHQEISQVLAAGASPDKIIYANPCKASSFIRHASKQGVDMMTFDNADELYKVAKYHSNAKMVLRILTDDSGSLCKLGLKFGAPLQEVRGLLLKAKELNIQVIGISFHVGSGCTNPLLFADAVARAKWAFGIGKELGFEFTLLDIGGGFGGENFREIAAVLRPALDEHFPAKDGVRIIAEPGRYFVSEAFEMATNVIARRGKGKNSSMMQQEHEQEQEQQQRRRRRENQDQSQRTKDVDMVGQLEEDEEEEEAIVMYYINDGVYGAFNCTMFDHQVVHPKVLTLGGTFVSSPSPSSSSTTSSTASPSARPADLDESTYEACSIWGPTCDSIDCVSARSYLPTDKVQVGDWLKWENMGAYTICAASQFNGFKQSRVIYTIEADLETENVIRGLLQ